MSSKYSNSELYKSKYLKYKAKYITLKNIHGGTINNDVEDKISTFFTDLRQANTFTVDEIKADPRKTNMIQIEFSEFNSKRVVKNDKGDIKVLNLMDMNISKLPDSIVDLTINDSLLLGKNPITKIPANFADIQVGSISYANTPIEIHEEFKLINSKIKAREDEKKLLALTQEEDQRIKRDQETEKARKAEQEARKAEEEAIKAKQENYFNSLSKEQQDKILADKQAAREQYNKEIEIRIKRKEQELIDFRKREKEQDKEREKQRIMENEKITEEQYNAREKEKAESDRKTSDAFSEMQARGMGTW